MKYFHVLFIGGLMLSSLSLWGCTQQKTVAITTKLRELESRYVKLEDENRGQQANLELQRKRLNQSETQKATLEQQKAELDQKLEQAEGEREALRKQIVLRTTECNLAQTRLVQFSKDLQVLAGRIESALNDIPNEARVTIIPTSRQTN